MCSLCAMLLCGTFMAAPMLAILASTKLCIICSFGGKVWPLSSITCVLAFLVKAASVSLENLVVYCSLCTFTYSPWELPTLKVSQLNLSQVFLRLRLALMQFFVFVDRLTKYVHIGSALLSALPSLGRLVCPACLLQSWSSNEDHI